MARQHWRTGLTEMRGSLSIKAYMATASRYVPDIGAGDVVRAGVGVRTRRSTGTAPWSTISASASRTASPRSATLPHPQPPPTWRSPSTSWTGWRAVADAHRRAPHPVVSRYNNVQPRVLARP